MPKALADTFALLAQITSNLFAFIMIPVLSNTPLAPISQLYSINSEFVGVANVAKATLTDTVVDPRLQRLRLNTVKVAVGTTYSVVYAAAFGAA